MPGSSIQLGLNFPQQRVGGYGVSVTATVGSTGAQGFFDVAYGDSGNFYYGSPNGHAGTGTVFAPGSTITFFCRTVGSPAVSGDVYAGVTQVFFYASGTTNSTFTSFSLLSVG